MPLLRISSRGTEHIVSQMSAGICSKAKLRGVLTFALWWQPSDFAPCAAAPDQSCAAFLNHQKQRAAGLCLANRADRNFYCACSKAAANFVVQNRQQE